MVGLRQPGVCESGHPTDGMRRPGRDGVTQQHAAPVTGRDVSEVVESPCWRRHPLSQHFMKENCPLSICYGPGTGLYKPFSSKPATHHGKKSSSAASFTDGRLRTQQSQS